MPRSPHDAIAWGLSQTSGYKGLCLQLARESYDVPALYSSADADWYGTGTRHETSNPNDAPYGALLHFSSPTSPQYGHIAINEGGGMMMTSSDSAGGGGHSQSVQSWVNVGYRLRGWKSRINDVEVLGSSGGGGSGDDDDPKYVNQQTSVDWSLPADSEWRTVKITDDGGLSLLAGPAWASGEVSVTVEAPQPGTEVDLRVISVDTKSGQDTSIVSGWPAAEYRTAGGQTQIVFPFANHIGKADSGWTRRLRFQIKAWGGGTVKVLSAGARATYWEG